MTGERRGGATGVRIVDGRVHRRTGPWTPAVHDLLSHVRAHGVPEAPEVLGIDESGDEMLAYIPGDDAFTGVSDDQLGAIGDLLRRLRRAMATFPTPEQRTWRGPWRGPALVHGDVAWWNLVWRGDRIAGLLDWDLAALSTPLFDLAYAAWTCVPLEPPEVIADAFPAAVHDPHEQGRRLRLLADAYGCTADERRRLLGGVAYAEARVAFVLADGNAHDDLGLPGIWQDGRRLAGIGRSMVWLDEHRDRFDAALR